MTWPSFLIIGAAKAGTSSVYAYLGQHPEIYTSPIKGPCFFAFDEGARVRVAGPGDQATFDRHVVTDAAAYRRLFDGVRDEKAAGEASVLYLYSPTAAARIRRAIPAVKLIAILRDPAERAFSSFLHLRRDGREPLADFADALAAEDDRVRAQWQHLWHYTRLGFYHEQLRRYVALFPREQVAVFTDDELRANPRAVLRRIFAFLGVDDTFVPDVSRRHNVSGQPRSRLVHRFLGEPGALKSLVKPLVPAAMRTRLRARANRWNVDGRRPRLPDDLRRALVALYRDDIVKLQALIDRDLSGWLATSTGRDADGSEGGHDGRAGESRAFPGR